MSKWPESPQKEIPEGASGKEPLCALQVPGEVDAVAEGTGRDDVQGIPRPRTGLPPCTAPEDRIQQKVTEVRRKAQPGEMLQRRGGRGLRLLPDARGNHHGTI